MSAGTPLLIEHRNGWESTGRVITRTYQVQCSSIEDGPAAARAAVSALPRPAGLILQRIEASHIDRSPLWFTVEAEYAPPRGRPSNQADDPLERPSLLSTSYDEFTELYIVDALGTPVLNTAFDRFDPMPQRRNGNLILQVTKNLASNPILLWDQLKFSTNAAAVTIRGTTFPADTLLFLPVTAQEQYERHEDQEYFFFQTTFRLAAEAAKHKHVTESTGTYALYGDGEGGWEKKPIMFDGLKVDKPWPLDANGQVKEADEPGEEQTFFPYPSLNWGIDFD